jgi:uncharacterized membrane protein YedE/YeeE
MQSLLGGAVIGLAAAMFLLLNGRIAGISGVAGSIVSGVLGHVGGEFWERAAFIVGLILGPLAFLAAHGEIPAVNITGSLPVLIIGGLLVGFGTRLAGGCTSGHGICGMARLSTRSITSVAIFFGVAIVTVFVMEHVP